MGHGDRLFSHFQPLFLGGRQSLSLRPLRRGGGGDRPNRFPPGPTTTAAISPPTMSAVVATPPTVIKVDADDVLLPHLGCRVERANVVRHEHACLAHKGVMLLPTLHMLSRHGPACTNTCRPPSLRLVHRVQSIPGGVPPPDLLVARGPAPAEQPLPRDLAASAAAPCGSDLGRSDVLQEEARDGGPD